MSSTKAKDPITTIIVDPLLKFAKESQMLINIMKKPDQKEFAQIAFATGMGFLLVGFTAFFVRLCCMGVRNLLHITLPESLMY